MLAMILQLLAKFGCVAILFGLCVPSIQIIAIGFAIAFPAFVVAHFAANYTNRKVSP